VAEPRAVEVPSGSTATAAMGRSRMEAAHAAHSDPEWRTLPKIMSTRVAKSRIFRIDSATEASSSAPVSNAFGSNIVIV
jgi:hypothetical protein